MDWRLIDYQAGDPFFNMACDEAIFDTFCGGWCPPTVRFYGWNQAAVSVGYLQPVRDCLDIDACRVNDVAVVRRPTGGRAVAHGTDFTFSVFLDVRSIDEGGGIAASYKKTGEAVVLALDLLGIKADFCQYRSESGKMKNIINCFDLCLENEVACCGTKVLGCAQLRRGNAVMQQNSLALVSPPAAAVQMLGEQVRNQGVVESETNSPEASVISKALRASFQSVFGVELVPGRLTHRECKLIETYEARYRSDIWNYECGTNACSRLTEKIS